MELLLENAINSIQIGVEDYKSDDKRRIISSIRNIYAGILLLYKHYLITISPPYDSNLLIKSEIRFIKNDEGIVVPIGFGKRTINSIEIENRFISLKISVDWDKFRKLKIQRNEIEHYFSKQGHEILREILSDSFVLIRDFIVIYLNKDPASLLGEMCFSFLLENNHVYEETKKICQSSLENVEWKYDSFQKVLKYLRCPSCQSSLIKCQHETSYSSELKLTCSKCLNEFQIGEVLEKSVEEAYRTLNYSSIKERCEPVTGMCPECLSETYIIPDDICLMCESKRCYTECYRCGSRLSIDEQDYRGLCSYCEHICSKDD